MFLVTICLVLLPQNLQSHLAGTLIPKGTQGVEKLPGGLGFRVSAWYGIATLCILVCLADRATYSKRVKGIHCPAEHHSKKLLLERV